LIVEVLKKHKYTIKEELTHGISGRVFLVSPDEDSLVVKEINYRDVSTSKSLLKY